LSEGCPHGRDRIHWVRAEAEFREKFAATHSTHCLAGLHDPATEPRSKAVNKIERPVSQPCSPSALQRKRRSA
jgi:hypothetical protein